MSVAWFDGATLTVEIAFTTDPLDPSPSWTDVSAYVRDLSVSCGRSSEFSAISPSTLSVVFDNRDRRFDPEHASGPYFGNLNPMKKIRVRWTYSAVTYDRFTGYVQGWPQQYVNKFDSTVTVQAVDGSRFLEQAVLPTSAYASAALAQSGTLSYHKLQGVMVDEGSFDLDGTLDDNGVGDSVSYSDIGRPIGEQQALAGAGQVVAQIPTASASPPKGVSFWVAGSTVGTVSYSSTLTSNMLLVRWNASDVLLVEYSNTSDNRRLVSLGGFSLGAIMPTGTTNHVVVTFDATNCYAYVNGQLRATQALTVGSTLLDGDALEVRMTATEGVSHVLFTSSIVSAATALDLYNYGRTAFGPPDGDLSGDRFDRVLDDAEWPASFRDLAPGVTAQGAYRPDSKSAMQYLREVETSEDGIFFIDGAGDVVLRDRQYLWTAAVSATFSDDGSDIPYRDVVIDANSVDPMRNKVTATYGPSDGYVFTEDTTSRDAYGPATEALSIPTIDDAAVARGLAAYKLRTMKDPQSRITSITVQPRAKPATTFPAILSLEIGDRVQVEITPVNVGSQVVKELTVQGFNERVSVSGEWATTFYLSPYLSAEAAPYLIIGDATYGEIGASAGNLIPF